MRATQPTPGDEHPRGRPLPLNVRRDMELLFGRCFRNVRLHIGGRPARRGALALTVAEQVYISPRFLPGRKAGWRLILGHELAHVLQQRHGVPFGGRHDAKWEAEAHAAGVRVASGLPVTLASIAGRRPRPRRRVQAIKLSFTTNTGVLDAANLCAIIDNALIRLIEANRDASLAPRRDSTYQMLTGKAWLDGLCQFAAFDVERPNGTKPGSRLNCTLNLGRQTTPMTVDKMIDAGSGQAVSERIHFSPIAAGLVPGKQGTTKTDLNYIEIGKVFGILGDDPDFNAKAAKDLLIFMMGGNIEGYTAAERDLWAGMVALMFGLEASRFPSSLATSVMLLDLILSRCTYGRSGKPFTLGQAFDKPDVSFDHDELYGGKYPCAVHKPGAENSRNRKTLGKLGLNTTTDRWEINERTFLQNATLKLNHRFVVPRREVTLFVHWIEANFATEVVLRSQTAVTLETLLFNRLNRAYLTGPPRGNSPVSLPSNPRADTGTHLFDPGARAVAVKRDTQVGWYENGKYFHASNNCKLISDRSNYPRTFADSFSDRKRAGAENQATQMSALQIGPASKVPRGRRGWQPCPYCVSGTN